MWYNLSMEIVWLLVLVAVVALVVRRLIEEKGGGNGFVRSSRNVDYVAEKVGYTTEEVDSEWKYEKRACMMTGAEKVAFRRLDKIFGEWFYVIPQVHLSELLDWEVPGQSWMAAKSHIDKKSVDFVLIRKENLETACAIELDDYTHERQERKRRDRDVERHFKEAGMPLARLRGIGEMSDEEIMGVVKGAVEDID